MSEEYLRACRRHWGSRGEFHRKELTGTTADVLGEFDIILALGLIHHLDDEQAKNLFVIARRALRPGGRMITLDGVFTTRQSMLVRTLLKWDRGRHVRDEPAYRALAVSAKLQVTCHVANDLFRVPYDVLIMECMA
jgi:cyclopropane fatty-acyl-phospholipid synthase-like methyltransferase